jgi:hypothetical protein
MKTLGKLKINNEKMLKNEELMHLRGGDGEKIEACEGKTDGADCSWEYNGNTYSGYCGYAPITFQFYCRG